MDSQNTQELQQLRDSLDALRRDLSPRFRVSISSIQAAGPYLGQPATIVARVMDSTGALFQPGVPVVFFASWGALQSEDGLQKGTSLVVQTGADGSARVTLRPALSEQLGLEQDALESLLRLLDPNAPSPSAARSSLENLALHYRWEVNDLLRAAVDVYQREFAPQALDAPVSPDYLSAWISVPSTVIAYTQDAGTGSLLAAAAVQVQFRNWLRPWLQVYQDSVQTDSRLDQELQNAKARHAKSPDKLVDNIFNQTRIYLDSFYGGLGQHAAQNIAKQAYGRFVGTGIPEVPANARVAVASVLETGASAIPNNGLHVAAAVGSDRIATTTVQITTTDKFNALNSAVAAKADSAALESFRLQTTKALATKVESNTFEVFRKDVNDKLTRKAELTALDTFQNTVNATLNQKVDRATFTAFQTSTTQTLATKMESSAFEVFRKDVNDRLNKKVEQAALDTFQNTVNTTLNQKVDRAAFTEFQTSTNQKFNRINVRP